MIPRWPSDSAHQPAHHAIVAQLTAADAGPRSRAPDRGERPRAPIWNAALAGGLEAGHELVPHAGVGLRPLRIGAVQLDRISQGARLDDEPTVQDVGGYTLKYVFELPVSSVVTAVADPPDPDLLVGRVGLGPVGGLLPPVGERAGLGMLGPFHDYREPLRRRPGELNPFAAL